jgi:hypothetical protein
MSVAFLPCSAFVPRLQAGSRPGGRGTFLCFAKEKYPKERRARFVGPLRGHTALLGLSGVRANSLRSNMRAPFPAQPCATRLLITAGGAKYQAQRQQGRAMARPCGVRLFGLPRPCVCAEKRSGGRIKRRACLSAASLRGSRLARASQVAPAKPGSQTPGSPFFAYFLWRSKESESPAGARPGKATPARAAHGAN